jgi:Pyruvate formate lyase.
LCQSTTTFFKLSIAERKAIYEKNLIINFIPQEILPEDLLCGARFNAMYSMCLSKKEAAQRAKEVAKVRKEIMYLISHGYGNAGATSGHLIPDYNKILTGGFKSVYEDLKKKFDALSKSDQIGAKGAQLKAMMIAAQMPKELAEKI